MDSQKVAEPECRLVSAGDPFVGKQALTYAVGISAETVGARGLHMQLVRIPPGGRARAHLHEHHETAIYALHGVSHVWHGPQLQHHSIVSPGEFFYIPAGVPHLPYNPSTTEDVIAVIARTDPHEQESVILLPELETVVPDRIGVLAGQADAPDDFDRMGAGQIQRRFEGNV